MAMVAGVPSNRDSEISCHPTSSKCTQILKWATKSKEWTEHRRWIIICCRNPCQIAIFCLKIMTNFVRETRAFAGTHSLWWRTTCSTSPSTSLILTRLIPKMSGSPYLWTQSRKSKREIVSRQISVYKSSIWVMQESGKVSMWGSRRCSARAWGAKFGNSSVKCIVRRHSIRGEIFRNSST